jgi:hypothetical protein
MKLDLSNPFDKKKFKTYSNKLYDQGAKVEIKKINPARSLNQNSYLHVCLSLYAINFGEHLEDVKKKVYKILCNRALFIEHIQINEETFLNIKSSAKLTTDEMTLSIERFRNFASQNGCYIPTPEEYMAKKFEIDKEIESFKEYL